MQSMFGMGGWDMNHVYRGIWIGGHSALQSGALAQHGIRAVVNAAVELVDGTGPHVDWGDLQRNGIVVRHVPLDDTPMQQIVPLSGVTHSALQFIHDYVTSGRSVLVNCAMGYSRSPSLVIAYLITYQNMSFDEAYRVVLRGRPQINPNPGFVQQLQQLSMTTKGGYGFPAAMTAGYTRPADPWQYQQRMPATMPWGLRAAGSFLGRWRQY